MRYPTARDEQAAYWYLKLREPDVSAEDIQAALAWQSEPQNRAAFQKVEAFWQAWPADAPRSPEAQPVRGGWTRWRVAAAAAIVVMVLLGAGFYAMRPITKLDSPAREYTTAVGQIRTVRLDDGSEVTLGGATTIRADLTADTRRILMSHGEALFRVAKDSARPFIVDIPNGSARALGTTFNVYRGAEEATITVIEGVVQVDPPAWQAGAGAKLQAGAQVPLSADGRVGRVREVNIRDAVSWPSGRLVFVDRTLKSIIDDLNRYSIEPVTLATPSAGNKRVSGTVKVGEIEDWLRGLGPVIGVDVVENEHGIMLVGATPAAPRHDR